jgi:hypothetical protein
MKNKSLYYSLGGAIVIILIVVFVMGLFKSGKNHELLNSPLASAVENLKPKKTGIVDTWVSSETGKGMQGEGKIVTSRSATEIKISGDVKVVIDKVEDNVASGTIIYNNLCYTPTITMTGKAPVVEAPRCINNDVKPVQLQLDGNKLSFVGQTEIGASIAFSGNLDNDAITGTFVWSSSYGKIDGTFDLARAK